MSFQGYSHLPDNEDPLRGTELAPLNETYWKSPTATISYVPSAQQTPYSPYTGSDAITEPVKPEHHRHLHHWESEKPPWLKTIAVQLFAFLWLVPIAALLYLNITTYILGASAWCPLGHCLPEVYGNDAAKAVRLPAEFDKDSHNLLGSLQLAAKALEVWFILICGWLVYLVTAILANRRGGLPIGYFFRSVEFAEIASIIDPLLWTTINRRKSLWLYVLGTVFLCILCNLMGPAVAVLVIPSLQWIETPKVGDFTMAHLNYDKVLDSDGWAFQDTGSDCPWDLYSIGNFSCATWWAKNVDALVEDYLAAKESYTTVSTQELVSFSFNATDPPDNSQPIVSWVSSRQIMSNISRDLEIVKAISGGADLSYLQSNTNYASWLGGEDVLQELYNAYIPYTKTVQTFVQRNGPILGASVNLWSAFDGRNQWETTIDSSRGVRCYDAWNITNTALCWGDCSSASFGSYTRCISTGTGWDDGSKEAEFSIDHAWQESLNGFGPSLDFHIYQSGRVAFLADGNLPSGFPAGCLVKNAAISSNMTCDWDAFFNSGQDVPALQYRSRNVTTWEIFSDPEDTDGHPANTTLAVDFNVYQAFAEYSLDTSWITNKLVISNFDLTEPKDGSPFQPWTQSVPIDPAWTFAAFAVDVNGVMDASRPAGARLLDLFDELWNDYEDPQPLYSFQNDVEGVTLMPITQLLSLIDHDTNVSPNIDEKNQDPAHPLLQVRGRLYVWAYGLASRTSYLGLFVTACGAIVVLMEILLGFVDRRRFRSPTQLLVGALEHSPRDEFSGIREEKFISRMSFLLTDDPYSAGRYKFEKIG